MKTVLVYKLIYTFGWNRKLFAEISFHVLFLVILHMQIYYTCQRLPLTSYVKIFYFTMFLSTAGTSKLHEARETWHSGWWSAKILMMISLMVLSFFVPSAAVRIYGCNL